MNRAKSGVLVSDSELEKSVLQASAARAGCPFGLVIGTGPMKPAGWRNSHAGVEELAAAAAEAANAAVLAAEGPTAQTQTVIIRTGSMVVGKQKCSCCGEIGRKIVGCSCRGGKSHHCRRNKPSGSEPAM